MLHFQQLRDAFRFSDEDDQENDIFSILSGARAWTSVIFAGKRDSRRNSTTGFGENFVVAETSLYRERSLTLFNENNRVNISGGKKINKVKLSGLLFICKAGGPLPRF